MRDIFTFPDHWSPMDALLWLEFMSYNYIQSDEMDMDRSSKMYWSRKYYTEKLNLDSNPFVDTTVQWQINMYYDKFRIARHNDTETYYVEYRWKLLNIFPMWRKVKNQTLKTEMDAKLWILKHITNMDPQEIRDEKLRKILNQ